MNRWPLMPSTTRRAVGICLDEEHLHWVEVDWPRRQTPKVVKQGQCLRGALHHRRDWQNLWRQTGVKARRTALALSEPSVMRLQVSVPAGLRSAEQWFLIEQSLQAQIPWPMADTAWDCQLSRPHDASTQMDETAQTHPMAQGVQAHWVEVVAIPKSEVRSSRQWCRKAGLQLTRLEPMSQAQARGLRWRQAWAHDPAQTQDHIQANPSAASEVALGLALGAIQA